MKLTADKASAIVEEALLHWSLRCNGADTIPHKDLMTMLAMIRQYLHAYANGNNRSLQIE